MVAFKHVFWWTAFDHWDLTYILKYKFIPFLHIYIFKSENGALFSKRNINMQNIFKNGHNLTLQSELSPVYDYRTEIVGRISLKFQARKWNEK